MPRADRGFTLLEVLIALLVLGVTLTALIHAASVSTRDFAGMRERTLAGWVAANVLTETRLKENNPAPGRRDGRVRSGGRDWEWTLDVQPTAEEGISRLDVQVYADAERTDPVARLTGFTSRFMTP